MGDRFSSFLFAFTAKHNALSKTLLILSATFSFSAPGRKEAIRRGERTAVLLSQNKAFLTGRGTSTGLFFLLAILISSALGAQVPDSVARRLLMPTAIDTAVTGLDTLPPAGIDTALNVRISQDSLDAPVTYTMEDSMFIDVRNRLIHLYGGAQVDYLDISLKADHITLSWDKNIVEAEPLPDSTGRLAGFPEFSDGAQEFTAGRMRYNFRSRKGIVYEVRTTQEEVVVLGERSKFITEETSDTSRNDIIYTEGARFTTCTADHPHFAIRTSRAKVIPNQLAAIGPSNLEIMGVPLPLWLPFGFVPLKEGRSTGLLFPDDYSYSDSWGFGLENFGWFFPVGEHLNLSLLAKAYFKGTFGVSANATYRKRYRYNGSFRLGYDRIRTEDNEGFVSYIPGFSLALSHNQDAAAHPNRKIGGTINFSLNNINRQINNDFESVSRPTTNSNFNYSKNWTDLPISLTAGLSHSQNARTNSITVNFPQVRFQTQTIYPFRGQQRGGASKDWQALYKDFNLRYTNELRSTFEGSDSDFFSQQTFTEAQHGFRQDISGGTSFRLLRYLSLNPNFSYRDVTYARSQFQQLDRTTGVVIDTAFNEFGELVFDTSRFGRIDIDTLDGLRTFRTFSAGVSLNTQVFSTLQLGQGWLRGMRYTAKPSISFGYQPNYLNDRLGYYETVEDPNDPTNEILYSPFVGGIFGTPPRSERQMAVSYGLNNIFEAKLFNKRDSADNVIRIFDNFNLNGSYNFQADSLRWSPISASANTKFLKGLIRLSMRGTFDPYERAIVKGAVRRLNDQTTLSTSRVPFKLVDYSGTISTNITVKKIRELFQGQEEEVITDVEEEEQRRREEETQLFEETDFLSLLENFRISHNFNFRYDALDARSGRDTFSVTANSISLQGSIQLTDNMRINFGSIGYDFVRKSSTYPDLGFERDLHCWTASFRWAPTRNFYSLTIRVKPGALDFINVPYQRNRFDGRNSF